MTEFPEERDVIYRGRQSFGGDGIQLSSTSFCQQFVIAVEQNGAATHEARIILRYRFCRGGRDGTEREREDEQRRLVKQNDCEQVLTKKNKPRSHVKPRVQKESNSTLNVNI